MYNHNRAVAEAEQERFMRMMTARQRQVPYHLRRDSFKQATRWLSTRVGDPVARVVSGHYDRTSHRLVVLYRRGSTRLAGLVLNTLESVLNIAPNRA